MLVVCEKRVTKEAKVLTQKPSLRLKTGENGWMKMPAGKLDVNVEKVRFGMKRVVASKG